MLSQIQSAVPFNDLAVDAESLVRAWLKTALDRGYDIALHLSLGMTSLFIFLCRNWL